MHISSEGTILFILVPKPYDAHKKKTMAGTVLQRFPDSDAQKAVRADGAERWDVKDGDDGDEKHSILVIRLPAVHQAIVHSSRIQDAPILINTPVDYAKTMEDFNEMVSMEENQPFITDTQLAFLWIWMYEHAVLDREAMMVVGCPTVDVRPWRLALLAGMDDRVKRHLALKHELPYKMRSLKGYQDSIRDESKDAENATRWEAHIKIWEQKAAFLVREIQEMQDKLDGHGVTE